MSLKRAGNGHFEAANNLALDLSNKAESPINFEALCDWMSKYPRIEDGFFLIKGFKEGFAIPYEGPREECFAHNHKSAMSNPHEIKKKLYKEVSLGRVAGPFHECPITDLRVSPLGLVPKSEPGEFRMIFDLSFPFGHSVNAGISQEDASVQYTRFDEIIRLVREEGQGSYLFKLDIKSAFRLIPIHPRDFQLLGMFHNGEFFIDKCLPFGLSVSCAIFEKFSTFLEWALRQATGSDQIIHYLDDFCGGCKDQREAQNMLDISLALFSKLGVPIAEEKVEGPVTSLKFLGLEVDTVNMLVKLPPDKLSKLKEIVNNFVSKGLVKVRLRELQSVIGSLSFACKAIVPGRAFLRRLIDATSGVRRPFHRIRVTKGMLEDLMVWQTFLSDFNGASMMIPANIRHVDLFTDASGASGFGAYCDGHWVTGQWPDELHSVVSAKDITCKELFPIILALLVWGIDWANMRIIFHCDNQAVVTIINKQTCKQKHTMNLVRLMVTFCLSNNIVFKAVHVLGVNNGIADALSRLQLDRFRALAPSADLDQTPVPERIWRTLLARLKD